MNGATLPPVEALLPHRGTMLLIDRVLAFAGDTASAECTPRPDAWYADGAGAMPAWIGIELMAQTVAAHVGLRKRSEGVPPKQGALLGTRRYTSTEPAFAAGHALRIDSTMIYRDVSGLGAYDCRITCDGVEVATATLKVFEPDDFDAFVQGSLS
ncbi:MAG: hotdog family protein [Proteobacteria bacterium]|nr:hotdog family protein [Pseudomonadota bacterium]